MFDSNQIIFFLSSKTFQHHSEPGTPTTSQHGRESLKFQGKDGWLPLPPKNPWFSGKWGVISTTRFLSFCRYCFPPEAWLNSERVGCMVTWLFLWCISIFCDILGWTFVAYGSMIFHENMRGLWLFLGESTGHPLEGPSWPQKSDKKSS